MVGGTEGPGHPPPFPNSANICWVLPMALTIWNAQLVTAAMGMAFRVGAGAGVVVGGAGKLGRGAPRPGVSLPGVDPETL